MPKVEEGLAAGAIGGNEGGTYAGKVYVLDVLEPAGEWSAAAARSTLLGEAAGDYAGIALSWVGDTTGGGHDTLVIGGWSNDEGGIGAGKAYVYAEGVPEGVTSLADAPTIVIGMGSASEVKHGAPEAGDGVGSFIRPAGDPNGDGLADFWLGVNGADDGGADAGAAAFFAGPLPEGVVALRDADAMIVGAVTLQYVGDYVTGIGDFTGDGVDDAAISGEMDVTGTIWLLPGPFQSGTIVDAEVAVYGEAEGDQAGASIAGAGDTNADGFADFVVGAYTNDAGGLDGGAAYLVRGPLAAGAHTLAEATLRWVAEVEGDGAGRQVAGGGDYNGDGLLDLAFGAPYADMGGPFSGTAYVALGE